MHIRGVLFLSLSINQTQRYYACGAQRYHSHSVYEQPCSLQVSFFMTDIACCIEAQRGLRLCTAHAYCPCLAIQQTDQLCMAVQVMKAASGKFHPIFQWFYFDSVESLPENLPLPPEEVDLQVGNFCGPWGTSCHINTLLLAQPAQKLLQSAGGQKRQRNSSQTWG